MVALKGRKPEVKKSRPFIFKVWGYMFATWFICWNFAKFVVNYYNPGAWPNVGAIRIGFDFWEILSGIGLGSLIIPAVLEIFRKRK